MADTFKLERAAFAGLDRLTRHLDFHARRQRVIAENLANIDTPGYRARDVSFQERFDFEIQEGRIRQSVTHSYETEVADDEVPDQDGNTVALERQVAKSTSNNLRYQALTELVARKLGMLKFAAGDGRS